MCDLCVSMLLTYHYTNSLKSVVIYLLIIVLVVVRFR